MNNEILSYLFLFVLGSVFCFCETEKKVYFILSLLFFSLYSLIARYSGFETDFIFYNYNLESENYNFYYLKEPVFWFGSRLLYRIFPSAELVYYLFDLMAFFFVLMAQKRLKLPKYFLFAYFVFFPSVMGMQNVYRQFLSATLILLSISYSDINRNKEAWLFFVLASLTHNVAFLFAPCVLVYSNSKWNKYLFSASVLFVIVLIPYAVDTKSSSVTGVLGVEVYIFMIFLASMLYGSANKFQFLTSYKKSSFLMLMYLMALIVCCAVFLGSAQSKRVGMICLVLMLVPIVKLIEETSSYRNIYRFLFLTILMLPTFIFSSSFEMLMPKL